MKQKESWVCTDCGHTETKWTGSCFQCKSWNTMERFVESVQKKAYARDKNGAKPISLADIKVEEEDRENLDFKEIERVLGGGIVRGSLTLIGGDPGVGKSTLMLTIGHKFAHLGKKVLYISGEESERQTALRAKRLGITSENLYIYSETLFSEIQQEVERLKPDVFILDSIQIAYKPEIASMPGSIVQVKEIAIECLHIAKQKKITTFIIGHVTKGGDIAGPKVLEHIVDTVLEFEGDPDHGFRILRARKNRFGPTDEVAIFQMKEKGLEEVPNPSEIFLKERMKGSAGSTIIPTLEGSRPILIEVQALVATSHFSTCARRATGIDPNRLALLLAVLEKRMGYHFHNLDVFVSIAGGLRIREPAIDLGITLAIASSFCNRAIDPHTIVFGEVGLGGELRSVGQVEGRIRESAIMGFKRCIIPKKSIPKTSTEIEVIGVDRLDEAISKLLQ